MPTAVIPSFQVRYTPFLVLGVPIFAGVLIGWSSLASAVDPASAVREGRFVILAGAIAAALITVVPFARTPLQLFGDRLVPSVPLLLRPPRSIAIRKGESTLRIVWSTVPRLGLVYGLEVASAGGGALFAPMVARRGRARRLANRIKDRCSDLGLRVEDAQADEERESKVTSAITFGAVAGTVVFAVAAGGLVLGVSSRALSGPLAGHGLGLVAILAYGGAWLWVRGAPARAFARRATKPL